MSYMNSPDKRIEPVAKESSFNIVSALYPKDSERILLMSTGLCLAEDKEYIVEGMTARGNKTKVELFHDICKMAAMLVRSFSEKERWNATF
jgi:hypothetical protein